MVLFFVYTGLRISDVSGIKKSAVNLNRSQIICKTKKRGKTVLLGVNAILRDALVAHLAKLNQAQAASEYLFPTRSGRQDHRIAIDHKLRIIWKRAGVKNGHARRFRDTFACKVLEGGGTLYDVSKLLGISIRVAEEHCSPYVKELQERGRRLVNGLNFQSVSDGTCTISIHSDKTPP